MNSDAIYPLFLGFGLFWVALGTVAVIALLKMDNQPIRFGKWGLIVGIPIVLPFLAALAIAAYLSWHSGS